MFTTIKHRLRAFREDERGNLLSSIGFVLIAGVFAATLVGLTTAVIAAGGTSKSVSAMNTAVDARYDTYVTQLNSGVTPEIGSDCYDGLQTCVTLSTATDTAGHITVTLKAAYRVDQDQMEQTRLLAPVGGTHITGYDTEGVPVWGTATAAIGTRFTVVTAGPARTCALDTAGKAWCWGADGIGDTATTARPKPTLVSGDHIFTTIVTDQSTGAGGTCALDTAHALWCWGPNTGGQLGTGDVATAVLTIPTLVPTTVPVTQLSLDGATICALDTSGAVSCWGTNALGQAGSDSAGAVLTKPTPATTPTVFADVTVRGTTGCGTDTTGQVLCWGEHSTGGSRTPVLMSGALKLRSLTLDAAGDTCALDADSHAWCTGTLGGGTAPEGTFTQVVGGNTFTALTVDTGTAIGLTTPGNLLAWGANTSGQLGAGDTTAHPAPTVIAAGNTFTSVATRGGEACALDTHRNAWCWGANPAGQLGVGSIAATVTLPTPVTGGQKLAALTLTADHTFALDHKGNLLSWGNNTAGQLGIDSLTAASQPTAAAVASTPVVYKPFQGFQN